MMGPRQQRYIGENDITGTVSSWEQRNHGDQGDHVWPWTRTRPLWGAKPLEVSQLLTIHNSQINFLVNSPKLLCSNAFRKVRNVFLGQDLKPSVHVPP